MKTQRLFGIVWLTVFALTVMLWVWKFKAGEDMSADLGMKPMVIPVYFFGMVASAFLIRGARWAEITVGLISAALVVLVIWARYTSGWSWPSGPDGIVAVFGVVSAAVLLFPRRHAIG